MDTSLDMALAWPGFIPPPPRRLEPAGVCYEASIIREHLTRGGDDDDELLLLSSTNVISSVFLAKFRSLRQQHGVGDLLGDQRTALLLPEVDSADTLWLDEETPAYEKYLRTLDPRHWKQQDHYKVMGLSTLRYAASEEQIRLAYRKKVLKHHPDKRRHRGLPVKEGDDDYFSCISKAYEILSNPSKRRAFDSVDPTFDDAIPACTKSPDEFFDEFGPAFESNERWSRIQPVPKLGDANTPYEDVDRFYRFWYNKFESWREFSYLDEEDKEKGENRDERRWIEKQNKAAREKLRKDELKRLRTLIENAEKSDPRLARHKEEEKQRKEAEKRAREEARRLKVEEEERQRRLVEEEERLRKQAADEAQRNQQLAEKREKEARKKVTQKERKSLQDFLKEHDYFADNDDSARVSGMTEMDRLGKLLPLERLQALNEDLRRASNGTNPKQVFQRYVDELNKQLQQRVDGENGEEGESSNNHQKKKLFDETAAANWSLEESQLLVKAMTVFPVGTKSRWDVVAEFINEHRKEADATATTTPNKDKTTTTKPKTGKDVVKKVKEFEKLGDSTKEMAVKGQALKVSKSAVQVDAAPSTRMDTPAEITAGPGDGSSAWTTEEQKIFEQALRTYPSSLGTERWEKVAACLPNRTKKECIRRFKELSELVRAKKTALQKIEAQQKQSNGDKAI